MKNLLYTLMFCALASCGKNGDSNSIVGTNPNYEYVRPFAMSTNEILLQQNPIIHEVDLREKITGFDTLPITHESFQQIYDLLKVDQNIYSKYTVLKKTPDCQALVGYCKAYYIDR